MRKKTRNAANIRKKASEKAKKEFAKTATTGYPYKYRASEFRDDRPRFARRRFFFGAREFSNFPDFVVLSERIMKKPLIVSLLILAATAPLVGCKSGFGGCFTRNGSRVPTSAIAETSTTNALPSTPYDEVVVMQATSANSTCDPCAPNACDPCGTARGASASYPAQAYPGVM